MVTNVSVVPWDKCNGAFSYNGKIGRHAFCAGAVGADSCRVSIQNLAFCYKKKVLIKTNFDHSNRVIVAVEFTAITN